jgi:phosphonate metabolism-associated iron-containing alcohol dehydrogenase
MMGKFYNPVSVYTGKEGLQQLVHSLEKELEQVERILVLTRGANVQESEILNPLMTAVAEKEYQVKELPLSNPDIRDLYKMKQVIGTFDFQFIIAIGGGSVMDAAKALSALKYIPDSSIQEIRKTIADHRYENNEEVVPWIGIPTTSGTGSEVTCWATVWDGELDKKYSISAINLYAKACVILPELTLTAPVKVSVHTALDAICHATEAYWSVRTNPISRLYALEAIRRIRTYLPKLKDNLHVYDIRKQLALGSHFAGMAFSNTKTTACHSISYPLTLLFGIEHGLAASLTLGAVLRLNHSAIVEVDQLLKAFEVTAVDGVERFLVDIYEQYDLNYKLRDYEVYQEHVPEIVKGAFTKGRMDNNPVKLTEEDITEILVSLI